MTKLRVLSLSTLFPSIERPGFGRFVARQFDALAKTGGVDLTVVSPVPRRPAHGQSRDYPVHYVPFASLPVIGARWNPGSIARAVLPLVQRLHAAQPFDLVDAQFFYPDGPAAARIAAALELPLSIKARGSDIHYWGERGFARRSMLAAARQADGMLAVSQALKQDMVALGMAEAKIAVHHTGLDHAVFRPLDRATTRETIAAWSEHDDPVPGDGALIVSAGNLIPLKGHALVILALQQLPDVRLVIAGSGPEQSALAKLASNLGLTDRIHFAAYSPEQLATVFAAANAMVLPSQREGLANVWIEALACGTPLVITDVGGAREVVTDASAGRLVERTPAAIAAALRELLANPSPQDEVAKHAARFSWEANAAQLAEHYREVASSQGKL